MNPSYPPSSPPPGQPPSYSLSSPPPGQAPSYPSGYPSTGQPPNYPSGYPSTGQPPNYAPGYPSTSYPAEPAYGYPPAPGFAPAPPALSPSGQPLADFGTRLGAYLIDGFLLSLVIGTVAVVGFLALMAGTFSTLSDQEMASDEPPAGFMLAFFGFYAGILVLGLLFQYLYMVEWQLARNGQTLGKRMLGIRVIPLNPHLTLTRGMLTKRFLIQALIGFFGLSWLDGLWTLWDKPFKQTLHDKAADTVVVKV